MATDTRELWIEAGRQDRQYWRDLWRYRELFFFLAWRDILVRYKQTAIGVAWAVLRPVLTMVVFTVVFGELAKLPSGGRALRRAGVRRACCRGSCSRPRSPRRATAWSQNCEPDLQGLLSAARHARERGRR